MKRIVLTACLLTSAGVFAQDSAKIIKNALSPLTVSAYVEPYYTYDFNNPLSNTKPSFIFNHNRNNEVNVNLAFIKAGYDADRVRANFAIAVGTYMNANYAAEPGVLKNLFEGNVGVKLSKRHNLWLDAGLFPSHIGFESAIGKDNWTLTRSIVAENTPYFETGVKVSYTTENEKWFLSALALNGWQRIQRVDGNSTPSFGTQVTYKPSSRITLNSSTFVGNDKPDSIRQMRYFHNFYGIVNLHDKVGATLGFDIGFEQKHKGSSEYNMWFNPTGILRYTPTARTAIAARAEYYNDENGVIIASGTPNGFKTWGFSTNFDYRIMKNVLWRIEGRTLISKDDIFINRDNIMTDDVTSVTTALAISF
ncbi:MAG: porin [Nitrosospira sp.]|nr:porin [Nitrosospira sp.]